MKYKLSNEEDFRFASRKSSEINLLLARCNPSIEQQLLDKYWRQSAELLALATLAIRDKTTLIKNLNGSVSVKSLRPVDLTSTYRSVDLYNSKKAGSVVTSSSSSHMKVPIAQVSVKYL